MPIYEYRCPACEGRFEVHRSIADRDAETRCPVCGSPEAERVCSAFALGSGGGSVASGPT